jgi:hypothetical protein
LIKGGLLKKASAFIKEIKGAEILEELEGAEAQEPEDMEELEELNDEIAVEGPSTVPARSGVSKDDLDLLASQIEFSQDLESDASEEIVIDEELEIVSPFSAMLGDLSDSDDDKAGSKSSEHSPPGNVKDLDASLDRGLPLIAKPFFGFAGSKKIEPLELLPAAEEEQGGVIEEREGVPYVSEDVLDGEKAENLNRDFKELVDSVIK